MRIFVINLKKWKKRLGFLSIIILLLSCCMAAIIGANAITTSALYVEALRVESEKNTVIIDAGHGGEDPGAVGVGNVYEKTLNMDIAMLLGEVLTERGFAVIYTRTDDKLLYTEEENIKGLRKISDLKNRCKIAAEYPNAIFVSIHMNSFGSPKYSGTQVYYSTKNDDSRLLANKIQDSVCSLLQKNNKRTIKSGEGMYILENIENPGVLIECGFITNSEECKKLSEKEYQKELCLAFSCGIIEYVEARAS